jgi:peptidyl-prolyl cis-trans isomerase SurA
MSRISGVVLFVLFAAIAFAQPPKGKMIDGVVAVVGDKIILKSEVEGEYANYLQQEGNKPSEEARCLIVDQMLTTKLMLRQAELDSIEVSEEEVNQQLDRRVRYFISMIGGAEKLEEFYGKSIPEIKDEFRANIKEQILAQKMQEQITAKVAISPAEVKAYFGKIPEDSIPFFPAEVEIGQIIIFPEVDDATKEFTIDKLNSIRDRVLKGEKFSTLAVLYSQDPGSAQAGGDLGFFGRGEMVPEFEGVAFKLKPGEVSPVIRTKYGYHILQLIERRGDRVNCRHILIKPPVSSAELERARLRLDTISKQLNEGVMTFPEAVRKYTMDDESKQNSGMVMNQNTGGNSFTIEQLTPDMYFQIDKLEPGQYSAPSVYASQGGDRGWRIYYLKSRTTAHRASLDTDYDKIQQAALNLKRIEKLQEWFMKTRSKTYVKVEAEFADCPSLSRWK